MINLIKKNIIGLIVNSPVNLYFFNNIISTNHIKYIVVNKNYNYNSVFSILFSNNIKFNINENYKSFIFYKDKYKYPFNYLCKCRNYILDLYNINKKNINSKILLYKNNNNIDKFFDFYNNKIKLYKIYRIFKKDDFNRYFETITPIVYLFYEELDNNLISISIIKRKKNIAYIELVLSDNIVDFMNNVLYI
jgi:hypothetical protein